VTLLEEINMRDKFVLFVAAGLLLGTSTIVLAQNSTPNRTPGHEMQQKGSYRGQPGASGYSPGHEMQRKGSRRGEPGASGYAPGRETTGSSGTTGAGGMRR
jgi:hypothetical protein